MYCKYCGKKMNEDQDVCLNCGKIVKDKIDIDESINHKSKVAAGILGILFGGLGAHNFYLGYTGKAVAQLLITVLSCFLLSLVSAIWGFIEGILILTDSINEDANGNRLV